jgi:hypothetical protein
MVSNMTTHAAVNGPGGWELSWLPGRRFSHDQATTAMLLAEAISLASDPQDWIWQRVANWLAEIERAEDEQPSASSPEATGSEGGDR